MADLFQQLGEIQRQALVAQQPQVDALKTRMALQSALVQREQELADTKAKQEYERGNLAAQLYNAYDIARMNEQARRTGDDRYLRAQQMIADRQLEDDKRKQIQLLLSLAADAGYQMTDADMAMVESGDAKSISTVQSNIAKHAGEKTISPLIEQFRTRATAFENGVTAAETQVRSMFDNAIIGEATRTINSNPKIQKLYQSEVAKSKGVPIDPVMFIRNAASNPDTAISFAAGGALDKINKHELDRETKLYELETGATAMRTKLQDESKTIMEMARVFPGGIQHAMRSLYLPKTSGDENPPPAGPPPVTKLQGGSLPIELLRGTNAVPVAVPTPAPTAQPTAQRTGTADAWFLMKALGINPQNPKLGPVASQGFPTSDARRAQSMAAQPTAGPVRIQGAPSLLGTGYDYVPPSPSMLSTAQGKAIAAEPRRNIFDYASVPMDSGSGSVSDLAANIPALLANIGATIYGAGTEAIAPLARSLGVYSVPAPAQFAGPINERLRSLSPDELRQLLQTMTMVR